jgi:hypothetical protein
MEVWGAPWPTWLGWFATPVLCVVMIFVIIWIEGARYKNSDVES